MQKPGKIMTFKYMQTTNCAQMQHMSMWKAGDPKKYGRGQAKEGVLWNIVLMIKEAKRKRKLN